MIPLRLALPFCALCLAIMAVLAPRLIWPMLAGSAIGAVWVQYSRWSRRRWENRR
jgi:hypothetical protein